MPSKRKSDVGLETQLIDNNYHSYLNLIKEKVDGVMTNYILIGHYLNQLLIDDLYKKGNYASIYDLAKSEFSLSDTTIKNSMGVASKYCDADGNLKDDYKDFRFSALVELLPIENEKLLVEYEPKMTVKEIREKKKLDKPIPEANAQKDENYSDFEHKNDEENLDEEQYDDSSYESISDDTQELTYQLLDLSSLSNMHPIIYHLIGLILDGKTSNMYMNIVSKIEINLYLEYLITTDNVPFITIKYANELSITCLDDEINQVLHEKVTEFNSFKTLLSTLIDVQQNKDV